MTNPDTPLSADRETLFHARINQWTDALEAHYNERNPDSVHGISFQCGEPGRKFCRIVQADANGKARSVHAFYDMFTGDVYKAEGWAKPAKHVRYNLLDDASFTAMIEACDWSGGYLYLKR